MLCDLDSVISLKSNSLLSRSLNIEFLITRAAATFGLPPDCSFDPASSSRHHDMSSRITSFGRSSSFHHRCSHYSLRRHLSRLPSTHRSSLPLISLSCPARFCFNFYPTQPVYLHSQFRPPPFSPCPSIVCLTPPSFRLCPCH